MIMTTLPRVGKTVWQPVSILLLLVPYDLIEHGFARCTCCARHIDGLSHDTKEQV
jgi:hypothetical protein